MNYKWSIKDIKKRSRYLEHLQIKNPDLTDIKLGIVVLQEFIKILQSQDVHDLETYPILDEFLDEVDYLLSYNFTLNHCGQLSKIITGVDVLYETKKLEITKDEELGIVHDFYKDAVGGKFFETFLKDFNLRGDHLRFNSGWKVVGQTFFIPIINEAFIESQYKKEFFDIATLIHEYGHCIHFRLNYNQQESLKTVPFCEVVSIFFEILSYYHFSKTEFSREAILTNGNIWNEYLNDSWDLAEEIKFIRFYQNNYSINIRHLRSKIKNEFGISKTYFDQAFQNHYSKNLAYIFSLSIAIELLQIYKQDQDKAFYIISKMLAIKEIDSNIIFKELKKLGIYPNTHIKDYEDELKRELKLVS